MTIDELIGDRSDDLEKFNTIVPVLNADEEKLFQKIDYFHLGVGVLFQGFFRTHKMKELRSIISSKSIDSPYERLFAVFDRDNREYSEGQEIVLSRPLYSSPIIDTVRNSLSTLDSTFIVINGKVKVLPVPLNVTHYEPAMLINEGTRFKVISKEVQDWENPIPRLSCVQHHKRLNIVHVEVVNNLS